MLQTCCPALAHKAATICAHLCALNGKKRGYIEIYRGKTARSSVLDYTGQLDRAIERLHEEGRYRTFIDIERQKGQFPHAE